MCVVLKLSLSSFSFLSLSLPSLFLPFSVQNPRLKSNRDVISRTKQELKEKKETEKKKKKKRNNSNLPGEYVFDLLALLDLLDLPYNHE